MEKCTGGISYQVDSRRLPDWLSPMAQYVDLSDYIPFQTAGEVRFVIDAVENDEEVAFISELPTDVTSMRISFSMITDATLRKMVDWRRIKDLSIGKCPKISDDGLRSFSSCSLRSIDIARTAISHAGFYALDLRALESLSVEHHVVASPLPADWAKLGSLTSLGLYPDRPGPDERPGWSFLRGCANLTSFNSPVEIDDDAIAELMRMPKLAFLEIRGVKDRHFDRIVNETSINFLKLDGDFSGASLPDIRNRSVALLTIKSSNLIDAALAGIEKLPDLKQLEIDSPQVTAKGLASIIACRKLSELKLRRAQVSDDDVKLFAQMPNLRILDLEKTRVTRKGFDELRSMLPTLVLHWNRN